MEQVLKLVKRESLGTRSAARLRKGGKTPAVVYGQGKQAKCVAIETDDLQAAVRHSSRLVKLQGAANETALIQDMQWDPFGAEILHVDLVRVRADERITVTVPVELRGMAPGTREGGVLEQVVHEVEIEVLATNIPESLHVNINQLVLGETLALKDIEDLPEDAVLVDDPESPVVHCTEPVEVAGAEEPAEASVEPEVIGGKAAEDESEAES